MDEKGESGVFATTWRMPAENARGVVALFEAPPAILPATAVTQVADVYTAVQDVRREAESIVEAARAQSESIREEARRDGRVAGYEEVLTELSKVRAEAARLQQDAEQDMLELAFRVAGRILGRTVEMEPEAVLGVVASALEHARDRQSVVVKVHPLDAPYIEEELGTLQHVVGESRLYIDTDDEVERGGCVIETEAGRIDAQLDVQLEAMRRAIVGDSP